MAKVLVTDIHLTDIANAIRDKNGSTDTYKPSEMANAISNIETGGGGITPSGELPITENGVYDVTNYASANVNVPSVQDTTIEDGLINHTLSTYSNDRVSYIGYGTFYRSINLTSISFPNVIEVGDYAFWGCTKLASIDIPKLQIAGSYSFNGNSVINWVLPELITAESYAFSSMSACKTITAPKLVTVGANCFRGASGSKLQRVDLGAVETLGNNALYSNSNLDTLIIRTNKVCTLGNATALSLSKIEKKTGYIYVPDELVEEYKVATNWSSFASQIKGISELGE